MVNGVWLLVGVEPSPRSRYQVVSRALELIYTHSAGSTSL